MEVFENEDSGSSKIDNYPWDPEVMKAKEDISRGGEFSSMPKFSKTMQIARPTRFYVDFTWEIEWKRMFTSSTRATKVTESRKEEGTAWFDNEEDFLRWKTDIELCRDLCKEKEMSQELHIARVYEIDKDGKIHDVKRFGDTAKGLKFV